MSVDIVTVGFCPQYFSRWSVPGSKGNVYEVVLNGAESAPSCTCPAFKYSGEPGDQDCKHVRLIWERGCLWNPQWKEAGPNDLADFGVTLIDFDTRDLRADDPCSGCGQGTIAVRIAV